jgi:membrane protease YdiL (CAAX protease family)
LLIIILFIIAVLFKILDSFVLRLDELLGEAILTKGLGLLLVIAFVWAAGRKLSDIGFHSRHLTISLLLSGIGFTLIYVVAFLIQLILLWSSGEPAGLALTAVDPKTGMTGGLWFGLWLFATNLINSGMEEGLFRGVMIRHLLLKVSGWGAVLISAGFFAIWHLSWPIKHYLDGASTLGEAGFEAFSLVLATFIAGIIYGYTYLKTTNLWGPFLGHTINNTVLNVLFYQTNSGLRAATQFMTFMMVVLLGYLVLIPVTTFVARRWNLPELQPWG